jgi:hypothetical protein
MKRKTVYQTLEQRKPCLLTCYSAACSVAKMKRKTVYQTLEQRKSCLLFPTMAEETFNQNLKSQAKSIQSKHPAVANSLNCFQLLMPEWVL